MQEIGFLIKYVQVQTNYRKSMAKIVLRMRVILN